MVSFIWEEMSPHLAVTWYFYMFCFDLTHAFNAFGIIIILSYSGRIISWWLWPVTESGRRRMVIPGMSCAGLDVILSHCAGLDVILSHCAGLNVILWHCAGLNVILWHCASMNVILWHCAGLNVILWHCAGPLDGHLGQFSWREALCRTMLTFCQRKTPGLWSAGLTSTSTGQTA